MNNTIKNTTKQTNKSIISKSKEIYRKNYIEVYVVVTLFTTLLFGLIYTTIQGEISNLFKNFMHVHTIYTKKTVEWHGMGFAMVNSAFTAILLYIYAKVVKVKWTGAAFMGIMMVLGFSYYVHNVFAIMFIAIGIFIAAAISKDHLNKSFGALTLSTCLTPAFSMVAWGGNLNVASGFTLGAFVMIFLGLIAQKVGASVARVNEGITLANTGVSHGFIAVFIWAIYVMTGAVTIGSGDAASPIEGIDKIWGVDYAIIIYMSVLSTIMLAISWFMFDKQNGLKDLIVRDGKAPTDYFSVSGPREGHFNIWMLIHFSIFLEAVWKLGNKAEFGFDSNTTAAFLQVFAFAVFGKHIVGAVMLSAGFFTVYYATKIGAEGVTGIASERGVTPWNINSFMSLNFFGWLLAPFIGVNYFAPFFAAMLHATIHRLFGPLHNGMTLYNHGFSTFMSIVIIIPFFAAIKKLRSPTEGATQIILPAEKMKQVHDTESPLERQKATKIVNELTYYFYDLGGREIGSKVEFNGEYTTMQISAIDLDETIVEQLLKIINDTPRDPITEYDYWETLGDIENLNIPLLASMVDHAETIEVDGIRTIIMKRDHSKNNDTN